ncbi:MAG: EamA family transporter [Lachnospiraceae bacterium]|nr:EamA family transporter [Lachnospiraceae bacterium]
MWMLQVLLYGLLKGTREIVKKKSLNRGSVMEVLFFYTLFGFLFVCPDAGNAGGVPAEQMILVAVKSFVIFLAWMCSFKAIKKMPISLYGILDLSRVLFAMLLATIVMHERLNAYQVTGLAFVCTGLLMLKGLPGKKKEDSKEKVAPVIVMLAFASCLLNAFSGLLDKILMQDLNSSQLQFWYMLYLVLFYLVYIILTKTKIRVKEALKNPWIWILAILFIIADRSLFLANADPASRISVMTLIKQSGCLVTILGGKFFFDEKNIGYKLICASVIVAGIVIAVL